MKIQNDYKRKYNNVPFKGVIIPKEINLRFKNKFLNARSIDIVCHGSPDQDTGNAARPILRWGRQKGKEINICVNWIKTKGLFYRPPKRYLKKNSEPADLIFILDFNSKAKIPKTYLDTFNKTKPENIIGLDHHEQRNDAIKGDIYIDKTAKSACGVVYRFFEGLGEKLPRKDLESLYCGMLSDYEKSKLIEIKNGNLIKLPALDDDKNSKEILEKIESQLSKRSKTKVYKNLDVLSNLTLKEKFFRKKLFSDIKFLPNKQWAYIIIEPDDKKWISLGMKNTRTSQILKDLCSNTLNDNINNEFLSKTQKEQLKNIKGIIIFYRSEGAYQLSAKSKDDSAIKLINTLGIGGGKPNRAGGRILSIEKNDVNNFINKALNAAETLN